MCKPNGEASIPAGCPHCRDCSLCPLLDTGVGEETVERIDAVAGDVKVSPVGKAAGFVRKLTPYQVSSP